VLLFKIFIPILVNSLSHLYISHVKEQIHYYEYLVQDILAVKSLCVKNAMLKLRFNIVLLEFRYNNR